MSSKQSKFVVALILALSSQGAMAADTTFSNASTTQKKQPKLTDYLGMDLTVYYYGSSVTALGSPYQPTPDGYDNVSSPNLFETRFRPAYKITDEIKIGPVFTWNYIPFNGGDYNFGNIFIRLVHSKIFSAPNFSVFSEARFYLPTTEASQNADFIFGARGYLDMVYSVPKSSLSIALEHYLRGDIWGTGVQAGSRLVEYWYGPYVNYDFSSQWGAKLQIDSAITSVTDSSDLQFATAHLRAGIGFMPTPDILLAPHIYAPLGNFSWSGTVFNFEAWAKVF